ncbi:MAG: 16S rRNA (cytosine(967)-C(5))-methyltransferase RsmB [Pseudomonadota bacterium]
MDSADTDTLFSPPDALQSRYVALTLLGQCLDQQKPLDQLLDNDTALLRLDSRDRAFVRAIVLTALRHLGQVDDIIRRSVERPDQKIQPAHLHHLLRVAVTQLVFLDVPPHAAVNTAVDICDRLGLMRLKGFVNAILRRVAQSGKAITGTQDAARLNTPSWLLESWIKTYGLQVAIKTCEANMIEPDLDLTIRDQSQLAYWAETLGAQILPNGTLRRYDGGAVPDFPGFSAGTWWVQEAAASLAAPLLKPQAGDVILDMCAAPGGKAAQLAASGATVVAMDRSASRMRLLRDNMARLGLEELVTQTIADAATWRAAHQAQFTKILIDAPCSATGTLRRQPDTAWLKLPQDVDRLAAVQARILENAVALLAPGGTLVYCTCSLQAAEGEDQIAALLAKDKTMIRVPIQPEEVPGLTDALNVNRELRIMPWMWPDLGGVDGFFISRLRKLH